MGKHALQELYKSDIYEFYYFSSCHILIHFSWAIVTLPEFPKVQECDQYSVMKYFAEQTNKSPRR